MNIECPISNVDPFNIGHWILDIRRSRRHALRMLLLACFCLLTSSADAATPEFQFPNSRSARGTWIAKETAPPVDAVAGGVRFACPFTASVDRFYWDADVSLDLQNVSSLYLDVTAQNPTACRTLSLYFRSGDGWYHWSEPIRGEARQSLALRRSDFSVEGSPAGWHRIDGIRIAPWKATEKSAAFVVHGLSTASDDILLVQATESAGSPSEKTLSRRTAQRVSGWLDRSGIAHGAIDDTAVAAGSLAGARVAILCYLPAPPRAVTDALRAFLSGGGKLIVLYSAENSLAEAMGVRLGHRMISQETGRWSALRFLDPERYALPHRVADIAWSLVPARPSDTRSEIIATWEDATGTLSADPACLATPNGFWFTYVPRDEDPDNKARLMLALVGRFIPSAWQVAARHRMEGLGRVGGYNGLADALASMQKQAGDDAVHRLLEDVRARHRDMTVAFARKDYTDVLDNADVIDRTLLQAYGRLQSPRPGELRAVWDHDGVGWYPGQWPRSCRELASYGFNAVFPNLVWPGKAHYPSDVVPRSKTYAKLGDQLDQCLGAARASGMQVHVWTILWNAENAPADWLARMRREGRLQQSADGATQDWLCPSHPENIAYELESIREIVRRYPVDGIHLDYVRYPGAGHCFSPVSRSAFEQWLGFPVANWPQAAQAGGSQEAKFKTWRAAQITDFVRRVRSEINAVNPSVKLSAAVYQSYPSCRDAVGQDWGDWLAKGYVDFVCPMNYTADESNFRAITARQLSLPGARNRVMPGIGVMSSESQLRADEVIAQIHAARAVGATGFVLFDLSATLRTDILPILGLGTTRP